MDSATNIRRKLIFELLIGVTRVSIKRIQKQPEIEISGGVPREGKPTKRVVDMVWIFKRMY